MSTTALYQRYRPQTLDEVVGQPQAVSIIKGFGQTIPNAVMLHGHTGTGKTSLARIMARMVGCPPENTMDYQEINCGGVKSPLDTVREIISSAPSAPMFAPRRVWVLDEVQTFSRNKGAQEALLMVLESSPDHACFFLCTTEPKRVLPAVRGRCKQIPCSPLSHKDLTQLVEKIARVESIPLTEKLTDKIVEAAAGSARNALEELEKIAGIADEKERLAAVGGTTTERSAKDLIVALLPYKGSPSWGEVAKILESCREEEPESLRQILLSAARTRLLKATSRASGEAMFKVIDCLDKPYFDRSSGHALLAAACFLICFGG